MYVGKVSQFSLFDLELLGSSLTGALKYQFQWVLEADLFSTLALLRIRLFSLLLSEECLFMLSRDL
jgi:hypothetical protein